MRLIIQIPHPHVFVLPAEEKGIHFKALDMAITKLDVQTPLMPLMARWSRLIIQEVPVRSAIIASQVTRRLEHVKGRRLDNRSSQNPACEAVSKGNHSARHFDV